MLTTDVLYNVDRSLLYICHGGQNVNCLDKNVQCAFLCTSLIKLSVQDKIYLSCPEKLLSFSLFHKRGADMIIVKFQKFPMKISEKPYFSILLIVQFIVLHTQWLPAVQLYNSPTDVYLAKSALQLSTE